MSSYVRFAWREYAPILSFLCGLVLLVLFVADFRELMVLGTSDVVDGLFVQWLLYGAAVGFATACWDEARGTLDYAWHRGVSYARQTALYHVAALPWLAALVVLPVAIWGGLQAAFHPDAGAADWSRLPSLAACGTVVPAAYGVGFWAGALRRAILARIVVAVVAGAALATVGRDLMAPDVERWTVSAAAFAATMLAIGAGFTALGHHAFGSGAAHDPDRPLSAGRAIVHGAVVALAVGVVVSQAVRSSQRMRQMSLHAAYPMAVESGGEVVLLSNDVVGVEGFVRVDERHEPVDRAPFAAPYEVVFSPWTHWARVKDPVWAREGRDDRDVRVDGVPFVGPWKALHVTETTSARLDLGRGVIRVVFLPGEGGRSASAVELAPAGGRFTRRVRVLGKESRELPVRLLDDGELYVFSCDGGAATLERTSLPDGDRPVHAGTGRGRVLVEGERGVYVAEGDAFVRLDDAAAEEVREGRAEDEAERAARAAAWAAIDDPLRYDVPVEVGGRTRTLRFRPRTDEERRLVAVAEGVSLLRPPVLLAASALAPVSSSVAERGSFEDARWIDPLYAGGKREVRLGLAFAAAAALGAILVLRLRRIGADAPRALGWLLVVLAFGPAGFAAGLLFETPRGWRWAGSTRFEPAPPPLVVTPS
ncbi:MAG: hypothetical protein ACF8XB_04120 [Planctomycetota bacterium JB042]